MSGNLENKYFKDINLNDPFFDSLKRDYETFENWFLKKEDSTAYVHYNDNNSIDGFLYYKFEYGKVHDVTPEIIADKILKIGTFKINPHGSRLGERFIKKALEYAVVNSADICYVTIFNRQKTLIDLLKKYGFQESGRKVTKDGIETVLTRNMYEIKYDICKDYPLISTRIGQKYLLGIYPKYHSKMFPDSILTNENNRLIEDVSYTNSIHKHYVCSMYSAKKLKRGDLIVIYRTAPREAPSAEYTSVATSICTVENIKYQQDFNDFKQFYEYACKYSLFDEQDLYNWYQRGNCFIIKMLYNLALPKRITKHSLIENVGISRYTDYWGFVNLDKDMFNKILGLGGVYESFIIN